MIKKRINQSKINQKRLYAILLEVSPDLMVGSALCASEVAVTKFLSGKDVAKTPFKAKSGMYLEKSFGRPKPLLLNDIFILSLRQKLTLT